MIKVIAHPSAKVIQIKNIDDVLHVYVKERPEKHKANVAIVKLLTKHFGKKVRLKAGSTSKYKYIVFDE